MHNLRLRLSLALLVASGVLATPVVASDPVGVYAIVDKVVLEPNDTVPTSVHIWGVFALSDGQRGGYEYKTPQRGYLYYAINPGNERACRAEWSDLRSVSGSGQPVGFGGRYDLLGRVRRPSESLAAPDVYPLGFGLVKTLGRNPRGAGDLGGSVEHDLMRAPAVRR